MVNRRHRILLVESQWAVRTTLRRILAGCGWEVAEAATVAEGLERLSPAPEYILLDPKLPDGDGQAILRRVREGHLPTRVLVDALDSDPPPLAEAAALGPEVQVLGPRRAPGAEADRPHPRGAMPMSTAPLPRIRVEDVQGIAVVGFVDDRIVSEEVIQQVGGQLYGLVEDQGYTRILLNFTGVNFMSSAMLGKLMGLHKRVVKAGGRLKLCGLRPQLREVFRIGQFDRVLEIVDDELTALDSF